MIHDISEFSMGIVRHQPHYTRSNLSMGVLKKRLTCSKNMQQIYWRTAMLKRDSKLLCNFIEIVFWHGCSPVNLLHIFRHQGDVTEQTSHFFLMFWLLNLIMGMFAGEVEKSSTRYSTRKHRETTCTEIERQSIVFW